MKSIGKRVFFNIFEPATTLRDRQDAFRIDHIDHRTDKLAFLIFQKSLSKKTYRN